MYIPKHFEITDDDAIFDFLAANSFGQLVSSVNGRHYASHIPLILSDDKKMLIGHLAKQNPQRKELLQQQVLVTFQGPHDYISPSWLQSPGVPTWNYQTVHIYGQATVFREHQKLASLLATLTEKYESRLDTPWQAEYKDTMLEAIVGIEINIEEIQCKFKLSQNRSADDQASIIEKLTENNSKELALAMENNK